MENAEYKILQKDRHNYGIDLLRIVAMLLIICYHITRYSDQLSSASVDSHEFSSIILGSWGILGVDLFVIVSAWFLAESNFKIQKVIGLIFETFCYMTIFVGVAFGVQCFQNGTAGAAKWLILFISDSLLEPIWSKNYWFISAYLILYLLFPCINSVIRNCSDKKLSKIVILLSFIPFYANYASEFSVVMNVTYFVYIYFLVALLKRKKENIFEKYAAIGAISVVCVIIGTKMVETVVVSGSVTGLVWEHLGKIMGNTNRHSLIMLVAALFVFYIFKNIKIKNSNIVGWIAGNVFGIYLFHENIVFLMSEKITFAIDKIGWSSKLFVVEYILIALCIFGAGLLFEAIRNSCIQKPFTIWINKKYPQQLKKVSSWFNEY